MKFTCPICNLENSDQPKTLCKYCVSVDAMYRNDERLRREGQQEMMNRYFLPAAIFAASGWIIAGLIFFLK